jgi:MFS transporter, ACS family, D-galactonate transporter
MKRAKLKGSESAAVQETGSGSMSIVVALLAFSVFINYIDRANLSTAASMLKDELGISAAQLGLLLSAFYWTYGLSQIVSGWLVDRFNVNWVMAIGFFLWSAATGATGLLHGFAALLVVRLILGVGESVAYPSYSRILAKYCPASQRGFANALIASGLASGPAFGILMGGILMARFGWRSFFIGVGLISLLWLAPWFRWMPRGDGQVVASENGCAPTILDILRQRPAWGTFIGLFCNAYSLYFLISWLPFYLLRERHLSMNAMAKVGGAVFLAQAMASVVCGRLADRRIAAGASRTRVHLMLMTVGMLGTGLFLMVSISARSSVFVWPLLLVGVWNGTSMSNVWPITQTLAGPQASGRWTGLQCAFANTSGALSSALTGFILDKTSHIFWAATIASALCGVGVLSWLFIVRRVEPVVWRPHGPLDLGKAGVELA